MIADGVVLGDRIQETYSHVAAEVEASTARGPAGPLGEVQQDTGVMLQISFTIANRGVAGEEVPQVYLGEPATTPPAVQFAVRAMAAFDRIKLEAGQSREITLEVSQRDLCFWSTTTGCWTTAKGVRTVYVGSSSRDLPLAADIIVG